MLLRLCKRFACRVCTKRQYVSYSQYSDILQTMNIPLIALSRGDNYLKYMSSVEIVHGLTLLYVKRTVHRKTYKE